MLRRRGGIRRCMEVSRGEDGRERERCVER